MEWLVPILDAVLGSLVRSGLMLITGFLIKQHLVSQQIADQFVSDGVAHVLIAVPALVALAWSVWVKVRGRARFLTALQSPPGTTEEQVKDKVASGMGASLKVGAVLLACVLAGAAASGCAGNPKPNTSQLDAQGQSDLRTVEVVKLVNDVTDGAIAANRGGALPDALERAVLTVNKAVLDTIAAHPSDAQGYAIVAFANAVQALPRDIQIKVDAYLQQVSAILARFR